MVFLSLSPCLSVSLSLCLSVSLYLPSLSPISPLTIARPLAAPLPPSPLTANTMMGLEIELKAAADKLKSTDHTTISLSAGCELFSRYVTRTSLELNDFVQCRARLIERGDQFAKMSERSRQKISEYGDRFIQDGQVILVHGSSLVVAAVLAHAATKMGKYFSVIVTEGRPLSSGMECAKMLLEAGIPVTQVMDTAVAAVMDRVDLVLVGAEGVVENGGVINQIGSYQIAIIAKALNTPVYVAAESYKFARLFPLTQSDLPEAKDEQRKLTPVVGHEEYPEKLEIDNPRSDYTPPQFITLLFTDLGILTPAAVSDELIKLYN
jgi:translation initiation factor eIF-2B subunit alpha